MLITFFQARNEKEVLDPRRGMPLDGDFRQTSSTHETTKTALEAQEYTNEVVYKTCRRVESHRDLGDDN